MTALERSTVDKFHERVISLIYKRRRVLNQTEWDSITEEIFKIEEDRKTYERNVKSQRQEKSKKPGSVPASQPGAESSQTETDVQS